MICTAGEALAADTLGWAEHNLGVVCNEFYGMTEVNQLIGNCGWLSPRKPGSIEIAYPGHDVRLVDGDGEPGEIVTPATAIKATGDALVNFRVADNDREGDGFGPFRFFKLSKRAVEHRL